MQYFTWQMIFSRFYRRCRSSVVTLKAFVWWINRLTDQNPEGEKRTFGNMFVGALLYKKTRYKRFKFKCMAVILMLLLLYSLRWFLEFFRFQSKFIFIFIISNLWSYKYYYFLKKYKTRIWPVSVDHTRFPLVWGRMKTKGVEYIIRFNERRTKERGIEFDTCLS